MELFWRGKYDQSGVRVAPAFPPAPIEPPSALSFPIVHHGDNLAWMLDNAATLAEQIDLIYIDPPFFVGTDFTMDGQTAYSDRWEDLDDYLSFMDLRLQAMKRLLKPTGSIYVHIDWRVAAPMRLMLEETFGVDCFLNEIVWCYGLGGSSPRYWPRKHDTIYWFAKEEGKHYFEAEHIPASSQRMRGQLKKAPDYWSIPSLNNMATERRGYPTQKPEALLERIIRSSSPAGGIVADFFSGSGTTLAVAQRLGRRAIGCDSSPLAIETISERLGLATGAKK